VLQQAFRSRIDHLPFRFKTDASRGVVIPRHFGRGVGREGRESEKFMRERNGEIESNIALLIDADNASPEHLDEVLLVLGELGTINIRRAYGNWAKASLKGWGNLTGTHSIIPMQQFDVVKGKSATDMRMTIDAMDLLYRGNVDGFGIMSSDSDFLPLAQRIREDGLPVYGFGTALMRSERRVKP
jgi:uncharacterized protein (TIGR00288 family)